MKTKTTPAILVLLFLATGLMSVRAADATPMASTNTPDADAILRQMSDKLGAAQKFSFKVHRDIDAKLEGLPGKAEVTVTVQRPDKLVTCMTSGNVVRYFYADGTNLTLFDKDKKFYSTVPMAASLDELPEKLASIYGFTPPLVEFVISDPYEGIVWRAQTITYAGTGTIKKELSGQEQVTCHRLALTGRLADAELWIGVNDLLPHRLTATIKRDAGNVHAVVEFSDWNLAANTKDEDFVFSPPEGVIHIPMIRRADADAAAITTK